jgi:hypothetical protein
LRLSLFLFLFFSPRRKWETLNHPVCQIAARKWMNETERRERDIDFAFAIVSFWMITRRTHARTLRNGWFATVTRLFCSNQAPFVNENNQHKSSKIVSLAVPLRYVNEYADAFEKFLFE